MPGRFSRGDIIKRTLLSMSIGVVVGAITLGGVSYAATGGSFILGRSNAASSQTLLTNSGSGPVLGLSTRSGQAPIGVSSTSGKATNLNADKLDGLDSTQLALAGGTTFTVNGVTQGLDANGDGINDGYVSRADCPTGTQLTGGGYSNVTGNQTFVNQQTTNGRGWYALTLIDSTNTPDEFQVFARCYNLRGSRPAGTSALRTKSSGIALTPAEMRYFKSH